MRKCPVEKNLNCSNIKKNTNTVFAPYQRSCISYGVFHIISTVRQDVIYQRRRMKNRVSQLKYLSLIKTL